MECIKGLYSDAEFAEHLVFVPEHHYTDEMKRNRLFHDMHTGNWWWKTQQCVERTHPGATIVPIIISSDKTQLTTFRNKSAYPIYLTIRNLPKEIRRKPSRHGQVLLGYLSTSKLEHITNKAAHRRTLCNLFHSCMTMITRPLREAGASGVLMQSGDGVVRRCHPILASYVGDYPEQLLVGCLKNLKCPSCTVDRDHLGDPLPDLPNLEDAAHFDPGGGSNPGRDLEAILDALELGDIGGLDFWRACKAVNIKPVVHPFWEKFPYVHIYRSITPDILHQLYQGVVKHLISWIRSACGSDEIDARCRRLPPNHHICLFLNGISHLTRVTGTEHDQICRFLLGLVVDVPLPHRMSSTHLLRTVRGIMDFLYLAQYPVHSSETLVALDTALAAFHENKSIFVDLGIREHFDIPKIHSMNHYHWYIEQYGTTDNYNTAYTERLHIDLAKDAYCATNKKDEYSQMAIWLERREKIFRHMSFIAKRDAYEAAQREHEEQENKYGSVGATLSPSSTTDHAPVKIPRLVLPRTQKMSKHPSQKHIPLSIIETLYGARYFRDALARYIAEWS
ncbi:hypothetical protein FISHEDRAFT_75626 [Fistulina hepatica ATCC 64428]|uniref:Uncharacterized protein n=1 Tax=Fistulina hepatica ATCC 64428 TaxID=1128425 RepID=A0A0D7A6T8_9AGAR|nr:hypothetical protein FISHEDRAFT_75626 [Fistulina hepatica ATCC 64428]